MTLDWHRTLFCMLLGRALIWQLLKLRTALNRLARLSWR